MSKESVIRDVSQQLFSERIIDMIPYYELEELAKQHHKEMLAAAAAMRRLPPSPPSRARRALAAALAALARRIDPTVWEGQLAKLQLRTGEVA
jgi:hypothetical protein